MNVKWKIAMVKIYRVQHKKDGRGPWRPGWSKSWIQPRKDHVNLNSWIDEFGLLNLSSKKHHGCGCRTVKQLRRWFTKQEYRRLARCGYHAVTFDAEVLKESDIQCVFERNLPLNEAIKTIKLY